MAMIAQVPLQMVLAQKEMHTSVQSAVIMLQDITMGFGHVKDVKHSLKEVSKVGKTLFEEFT